jgi:hypothetical protein
MEMTVLLKGHPEVDVDGYKDGRGWRALFTQNAHGCSLTTRQMSTLKKPMANLHSIEHY